MPFMETSFQTVLSQLAGVPAARFLLVGGWALNAYGVGRQTMDMDFVCLENDLPGFESVLSPHGYKRVFRSELFAKLRSAREGLLDLDFLFVAPQTMDGLFAESKETRIGEATFRVPSLEHLIAMKVHAMKHQPSRGPRKDLPDILALAEVNGVDVKAPAFRSLVLKHGDADIYARIVAESGGKGSVP